MLELKHQAQVQNLPSKSAEKEATSHIAVKLVN